MKKSERFNKAWNLADEGARKFGGKKSDYFDEALKIIYIEGEEKMKKTRVINLIPEDYQGNPRNALGYAWSELVMNGYKVDHEKSIPGEDLIGISFDDCLTNLEKNYGKIAVRNNGNYGFLKDTAKTLDGKSVDINGVEPIACINKMWCGGGSVSVFTISNTVTSTAVNITIESAGETAAETTAIEKTANKIATLELNEQNKHNPGWCSKCLSYCYGDCEANE